MTSEIKSSLNSTYIINLIKLEQNSPIGENSIWVLFEGADDLKLYPKLFKTDKCKIEFVHGGCGQLEKAIAGLQKYANFILGIQDADFLHLTKKYSAYQNLLYTDCHDIEMTMIKNDAVFNNILYEYSLQEKKREIKQNILTEASFIGYIRYYNDVNNYSIRFKGLTFGNIVTKEKDDSLSLQKSALINNLNERSVEKKVTIEESIVNQFISSNSSLDLYQLVSGHDFIELLQHRINFVITNRKVKDTIISISLRNSYQIEHFKQTQLYKNILLWQNNHKHNILN